MSVLKYREQIYAGVLGKIIGVYLGRPVEGWSYDKIRETFDEVKYYVHENVGVPLIVADDDISGTFAFFRALEDNGYDRELPAKAFGDTWLNYREPDDSMVGRPGTVNRAHGLFESEERHGCAGERSGQDQWNHAGGADRSTDFHRCDRHGLPR